MRRGIHRKVLVAAVAVVLVMLCHSNGVETATTLSNVWVDGKQLLSAASSPYIIDNDIVVTETGSLTIEAGAVFKFRPGTGLIVRGSIIAKVTDKKREK